MKRIPMTLKPVEPEVHSSKKMKRIPMILKPVEPVYETYSFKLQIEIRNIHCRKNQSLLSPLRKS